MFFDTILTDLFFQFLNVLISTLFGGLTLV